MPGSERWFLVPVGLWVLALGLAVLGLLLGWDALSAASFLLRRVAAAATVVWLAQRGLEALWRRVRRRRGGRGAG